MDTVTWQVVNQYIRYRGGWFVVWRAGLEGQPLVGDLSCWHDEVL